MPELKCANIRSVPTMQNQNTCESLRDVRHMYRSQMITCATTFRSITAQNQNPFVSLRDVWQSLPRVARVLLVWVAIEAVLIFIYALTILITNTFQQFVFPLLVRPPGCFAPLVPTHSGLRLNALKAVIIHLPTAAPGVKAEGQLRRNETKLTKKLSGACAPIQGHLFTGAASDLV